MENLCSILAHTKNVRYENVRPEKNNNGTICMSNYLQNDLFRMRLMEYKSGGILSEIQTLNLDRLLLNSTYSFLHPRNLIFQTRHVSEKLRLEE